MAQSMRTSQPSPRRSVAHAISAILNPGTLSFFPPFLATFLSQLSTIEIKFWAITLVLVNLIGMFYFVFFLIVKGVALDDALANDRVKRDRLLAIVPYTAILALESSAAWLLESGQPLIATLTSLASVYALFSLISYFWKISHHMLGVGIFTTYLFLLYGPTGLISLLLVGPIAWSRLKLDRHTPRQLLAGLILAPIVISITWIVWGLAIG